MSLNISNMSLQNDQFFNEIYWKTTIFGLLNLIIIMIMMMMVNLGHGDDVRDNTMGLESPEMCSDTSETGLDFIGYANSSGSSHDVVHRR